MRKLFAAMFCVILCFSLSALGETIDFSAMTTDELIELRRSITAEIEARTEDPNSEVELANGYYFVGEDIPAGKYEFYITDPEKSCAFYVFTKDGYDAASTARKEFEESGTAYFRELEYVPYNEVVASGDLYDGNMYLRTTLEEGMVVHIYSHSCYIRTVDMMVIP